MWCANNGWVACKWASGGGGVRCGRAVGSWYNWDQGKSDRWCAEVRVGNRQWEVMGVGVRGDIYASV